MSLQQSSVRFKPIPLMNQLAAKMPFYLPSETNDMRVVEHLEAEVFWGQLTTAVEQSSSRTAVVFVHGYNYGFERTCRMAAEMQRALQVKAAVVMFSWPSNGLPTDYVRDQADVEWSVPLLVATERKRRYPVLGSCARTVTRIAAITSSIGR